MTINNSANITYNYGTSTGVASSNVATTQLAESYSLIASKASQNSNWKPGENLTYNVAVTNDGAQPIYAVSVQDNLGGNTERLLEYISGSARMLRNASLIEVVPATIEPLTLNVPETLLPGETIIFSYVAKVKNDIDNTIGEIVNEAVVVGHETSVTGPTITVDPAPSLTIPKASYAEITIEKTVDKENVFVGEPLTYTFRLENRGNTEATGVVITDDLPQNFTITSIVSETNGVRTTFDPIDYTLDATNRLTLPTSETKTISVPPSTEAGSGLTIVTIVGQITD